MIRAEAAETGMGEGIRGMYPQLYDNEKQIVT